MAELLSLAQAKELYFKHISLKNYSALTINRRSRFLDKFIQYLKGLKIDYVQDMTLNHVQSFLKTRHYYINRKGKPNSPITRNDEIKDLKVFLSFLEKKQILKDLLSSKIKKVREPLLTLPKNILTKKELLYIFSLPDKGTVLGYRDRTIFELLYATGIRLGECVRLQTQDVLFDEQCVLIRLGKGAKDRLVPFNDTAHDYLHHYLHHIRPNLVKRKTKTDALFLTNTGKAFIPGNLWQRLSVYYLTKAIAKFKKQICVHTFRHTCATHLLGQGMPLRHVQELLGHKSLDTTRVYLHLTITDLKTEYRKFHPREQSKAL